MSRSIIFGGTGFIGTHIAEYLLNRDSAAEVVLADIAPPAKSLPDRVSFAECDVRKKIDDSLAPVNLIVNVAAIHRTPGHPDHEYHATNESGARNVTEFASQNGIDRIWFTSSIAVYGPDETVKTEASEPMPVSAYGKSKLAAEKTHRDWAEASPGRKLTIARPATVFGPGEGGNFTRLAKAMKRRAFFYPGRRDTLKACGYVRDLAPSFEFMEQFADPTALYNFAYPEPPTIEAVCDAFVGAGGLPQPWLTMPAGALLRAGACFSRLGIQAVNPDRIKKLMVSTNIAGSELARRGYEFDYNLDAGIRDWFEADPPHEFA